jgi:hypothetical protein
MGILRFQDVTDWQDAVMNEQRVLTSDPDDAGPIGRRACSPTKHTATWIQFDPTSAKLTYGPEKEIEVYRGHERLLPKDLQQKLGTREIRGWLFQVRESGPNPQPSSFALLDGKEILLSKLPHSRNYFVRRTLKPCKHEKGVWTQVARAWDQYPEMQLADERLDHLLQELSITPFVSFKGCRAAWAIVPERFEVLGEERFDTLDDYTVAALEIPFAQAYELLKIDPAIQRALDLTDAGCLFDKYHAVEDVRAAIRHGCRPPKGPLRRRVTEGLYQNRGELMKAACCAALCGREVLDAGDSVVDSAILLYHRFAYNFVDRERKPVIRPRRTAKQLGDRSVAGSAEIETGERFRQQERIREFTTQWRELGYDAAVVKLTCIITHILQAKEDMIDETFVLTLQPPLAGWPAGWKRPEGLDEAQQRLNKVFKGLL